MYYKKASFISLIFFSSIGLLIKLFSSAMSWKTMALLIVPFVFPFGILSVLYARYDAIARRTISFGETGFCLWNKKRCIREVPYYMITDVTEENIYGFFIGTQKENFQEKYICIYLNHANNPSFVSYAKLFKQKDFIREVFMQFFPRYSKYMTIPFSSNELTKKLKNAEFDLQGYHYQISHDSKNIIKLTPYVTDCFYHNSFIPNIRMEMQDESVPQQTMITFHFTKSVKWIFSVFECICFVFQIFLLISFFAENWYWSSMAIVFLPTVLAIGLYIFSYLGLKYAAYRFLKDFEITLRQTIVNKL